MISNEQAKEYAERFVDGWAAEARTDMVGIGESFDLEYDDVLAVMSWVDRARVTITFDEEV